MLRAPELRYQRRPAGEQRRGFAVPGRAVRFLSAGDGGAQLQLVGDDHAGEQHVPERQHQPGRRSVLGMVDAGGRRGIHRSVEGPEIPIQEVIILLTDGLNTENRWYTNQTSIDDRQKITCDNIKAAGITLYTVQVNTGRRSDLTDAEEMRERPGQVSRFDKSSCDVGERDRSRPSTRSGPRSRTCASRSRAVAHRSCTQKQSPAGQPGFSFTPDATSLLDRRDLAEVALERLVSLLGEIGIELAELGRFGDKAFV